MLAPLSSFLFCCCFCCCCFLFLLTVPRSIFFYIMFQIYLCYAVQPCDHLLGKGSPLGSLVCYAFLCFCHFPNWCSESGMIFYLIVSIPVPEVLKLFSCSTQLNRKFQLLIKTKIPTNKEVSCFKSLRCCIYHVNKC